MLRVAPDRRPRRGRPGRVRAAALAAHEDRRRSPTSRTPSAPSTPSGEMAELAHARGRRGAGGRRPGARRTWRVDVRDARLRLLRVLGPQGVRPVGSRRALRQGGAARGDAALAGRRRHDRFRDLREDDLQRAALQVRGGDAQHRRRDRPRRRHRLRERARPRRPSPPTRTSCWRYGTERAPRRARPAARRARRARRPGCCPSSSRASTPRHRHRSSTTRASRCAPGTTARSR